MSTRRVFVESLGQFENQEVLVRGWVSRLRVLSKTTFIVLKDCSGEMQCVASSDVVKDHHLKTDDAIEIRGKVRADERSKQGHEIDISEVTILNRSDNNLPFNSSSNVESVGLETLVEY